MSEQKTTVCIAIGLLRKVVEAYDSNKDLPLSYNVKKVVGASGNCYWSVGDTNEACFFIVLPTSAESAEGPSGPFSERGVVQWVK